MTSPSANPPRVGLIGAGNISRVHVQGWLALGAQPVVYSLEGAEELAALYSGRVVSSLDELWPEVDIVDIVTPTSTHAEIALQAIAQGKHVISEKPLARHSAAAADVVKAAADAGVHVYPAHVVRYFPEYAAAHRAITDGAIGQVAVCRFRRMSSAPQADWFFDEAISGGIVLDQMIHDLDQAQWMAGPVDTVFARSVTRDDESGKTASATVTFTHTNGAISTCYGVWGHPSLPFTYSFEIAGDRGILSYDNARDDTTRMHLHGHSADGGYIPVVDASESPYAAEIRDFLAAITDGTTPEVTGAEGVSAIELAEAANESIATGKTVRIGERSGS